MRIALDIDGTITRHAEFFSVLSQSFIAAGHEVFVLTNRSRAEPAKADLARWHVSFTKLITFGEFSEQNSLHNVPPTVGRENFAKSWLWMSFSTIALGSFQT